MLLRKIRIVSTLKSDAKWRQEITCEVRWQANKSRPKPGSQVGERKWMLDESIQVHPSHWSLKQNTEKGKLLFLEMGFQWNAGRDNEEQSTDLF